MNFELNETRRRITLLVSLVFQRQLQFLCENRLCAGLAENGLSTLVLLLSRVVTVNANPSNHTNSPFSTTEMME